jgi:hypothetical protein
MTCARQRAHTKRRPVAGIGNPRQCRCDIDRADGGCHTWRAPVPCRARVGLDTGVNLAVCAGVGPVSSAVGKTFFYRIQTPASPLPEASRAGCVCTRPSGSFRRTFYRPSVPAPVITKQLRRSDPLPVSDRRRHLVSDSDRRSQVVNNLMFANLRTCIRTCRAACSRWNSSSWPRSA